MTYELVKYAYGTVKRYTAFCLTPKLKAPRTTILHGATLTQTNKGPSSRDARHFETPDAAISWLGSTNGKLFNPDWSYITGTAIR